MLMHVSGMDFLILSKQEQTKTASAINVQVSFVFHFQYLSLLKQMESYLILTENSTYFWIIKARFMEYNFYGSDFGYSPIFAGV